MTRLFFSPRGYWFAQYMKHNGLAGLLCCFQGGWWENIWGMLLTLQSFPYDCSLRGSMPPLLGLSRPAVDCCLNKKEPDKTVQLRTSLKGFLAALLLIFLNMGGKIPSCFSTCFGGVVFSGATCSILAPASWFLLLDLSSAPWIWGRSQMSWLLCLGCAP